MKKKNKKSLKQKDKKWVHDVDNNHADTRKLKQRIKQLEAELKRYKCAVELQNSQVKDKKNKKKRKRKTEKGAIKILRTQQSIRVGAAHRDAWKRHSYLRDRYEFHIDVCHDKLRARALANEDLREKYGEEAGYSEQELEEILS